MWLGILISLLVSTLAVGLAVYGANVAADRPVAKQPEPAAVPDDVARLAASRQTALVGDEDARLLAQLRAVPHGAPAYVDRSWRLPTVVLTPRPLPYAIGDLVGLGAVRLPAPDVMELVMPVLVAPGARLEIHAPGSVLRMTSTPAGFTSLVAWKGALTLSGAPGRPFSVTSWDPSAGGADLRVEDGRAYVRAIGAHLQLTSTTVSGLGFWSGRTGGIAFTGSDASPSTGGVADTTIRACHYGLFSSDTRELRVDGVTVEDAAVDGVVLHRGTLGPRIHATTVRSSGSDGIIASRGAASVSVSSVAVEGSGRNGIVVDGTPLVTRPGPSGASPYGWSDFRIVDSVSRGNGRAGILVRDADDTSVTGNEVSDNAEGVVVRGPARGVAIRDNTVMRSAGTGIGVRDGATDVVVTGNVIGGATTGVQVRNARTVVSANRAENMRSHGVSVQGAAGGSEVIGNSLAGRGPSAIDLYRLQDGATVAVAGNGTETWDDHHTLEQRVRLLFRNHPLLPLWVLLLAVPVVATVLARSSPRRVRLPYALPGYAPNPGSTVPDGERPTGTADGTGLQGTRLTVLSTGWRRTGRAW